MAEASETREGLGFPFPVVTSAAPPLAPPPPRGPPGGSMPGPRTILGCGTGCVAWGRRGLGIGNGNGIGRWVDGRETARQRDGRAACFRLGLGLGWGW